MLTQIAATDIHLNVQGINLTIDSPAESLSPDIVAWLRSNKVHVIESIRLKGPCDVCGCLEFFDNPIHRGRSVRRDCASCRRTWGFPVWYGKVS